MDDGVCAATDPEEIEFVQSLEGCNGHSNGAGVQLGDPRVGLVTTLPYPVVLHANKALVHTNYILIAKYRNRKKITRCSNSAKKHTFKSYPSICVTVGSTMEERTLILIKPEGVQQGLLEEINSRLATQKGLKQVAVKTVQDIDDSLKKKWNAQHSSVLDKIDSGPVIALV